MYKHLKVFGYKAFCHVSKEFRDKLSPKTKKHIFLGYGNFGEMGYCLWDPEARKIVRSSSLGTGRILYLMIGCNTQRWPSCRIKDQIIGRHTGMGGTNWLT